MTSKLPAGRRARGQRAWRTLCAQRELILMVLPALALTLVFSYIPIYGISIAFQKYNPIKGLLNSSVKWVGLKWFRRFLANPYTWKLFRNTLLLGVYSLVWGFPAPILLALLMDQMRAARYKKVVQTISYMPHFLSSMVIVGLIKELFSSKGGVTQLIASLGMGKHLFLVDPRWFRTLYIGSGIWQGVGWGTIIYLAALTNVDPQLHEAALVDGANRFQRVLHVSLPAIAPTVSIQIIFSLSGILGSDWQKVLLLYTPETYEVADVISTFTYRYGLVEGNFEYSTAIGLLMSVIGLILITSANWTSRRISETSLW